MDKLVYKSLDELKPYENNPRFNDNAVDKVASSIKEFGFKVPIVVDKNNIIVAGHTRWKASKKLGLESVPCIIADDLTDEQIKAYRLADNKVGELAEWDFAKLETELSELTMDMSIFDFDFKAIEKEITKQLDAECKVIEDVVPEVNQESEPTVKFGEVWQLGKHRLMCGDSTDKGCVEELMNGKKANLIVTDPPYNVAYEGKTKDALTIQNDSMDGDTFKEFLTNAFNRCFESLQDGGSFYVWYASREHVNFETALNDAGLQVRQQLIWNKNTMVLGRQDYHWKHEPCLYGWKDGASHNWYSDRTQTTVLEFDKPARNGEHPTMKPVELIAYQIKNSSKREDVVLDLFGGSGSTLIACEQLDRTCHMMELDPRYCDVIIRRWESITGEKAVLVNETSGAGCSRD